MKSRFTMMLIPSLLMAGLMVAQTPQPSPGTTTTPHHGMRGRFGMAGRLHRMVRLLNLTDDQKTQAKAIFQAGRTSAQPLIAQMRDARSALANAVKSGATDAEIDRLSNNAGAVASQLTALRTKTFAKFYAILTPDQKAKLNTATGRFMNGARRSQG